MASATLMMSWKRQSMQSTLRIVCCAHAQIIIIINLCGIRNSHNVMEKAVQSLLRTVCCAQGGEFAHRFLFVFVSERAKV